LDRRQEKSSRRAWNEQRAAAFMQSRHNTAQSCQVVDIENIRDSCFPVFPCFESIRVSAGYATGTTRAENVRAICRDHLHLKLFQGISCAGVRLKQCKIPLPAISAPEWRHETLKTSMWVDANHFGWHWLSFGNSNTQLRLWWRFSVFWLPNNRSFSPRDLHSWKTRGELFLCGLSLPLVWSTRHNKHMHTPGNLIPSLLAHPMSVSVIHASLASTDVEIQSRRFVYSRWLFIGQPSSKYGAGVADCCEASLWCSIAREKGKARTKKREKAEIFAIVLNENKKIFFDRWISECGSNAAKCEGQFDPNLARQEHDCWTTLNEERFT
jgi:hypothetical protein